MLHRTRAATPRFLAFLFAAAVVILQSACGTSHRPAGDAGSGLDTSGAPPTAISTAIVGNPVLSPVPTAPPPSAQATPVPGVDRIQLQTSTATKTYTVYGSTTDEILGYISNYGPTDDTGQRASGLTESSWSLSWDYNHNDKACAITTMTIKMDIKVTLPALDQPAKLTPDTLNGFKGFASAIATHEQHHVDIFLAGAKTLKATMTAIPTQSSCKDLEKKVNDAWTSQQSATNAEQSQFHAQDQARIAALRDPIKAQIDTNRAHLDSIKATVDSLDSRLKELQAQMDTLNTNLTSLKNQLSALETQYSGQAMPAPAQQQYDSLRQQYNNLVPAFNALVDNYNSTLTSRNSSISQSETVRLATNALVDKYNWTR